LFKRQVGHGQTVPRFCRFVSVHKQNEKLSLNIECHEFYKLHYGQPAVLLYDTWQPPIACSRAGRAGQFIMSRACFLHPNPSHTVVVGHVWCAYALQLQFEHLYVLQQYNNIYMSFNTKCFEYFNRVLLYTQSHFSWSNCKTWHTALLQDVTHSPLPRRDCARVR